MNSDLSHVYIMLKCYKRYNTNHDTGLASVKIKTHVSVFAED